LALGLASDFIFGKALADRERLASFKSILHCHLLETGILGLAFPGIARYLFTSG
jgi:hypothetical protein